MGIILSFAIIEIAILKMVWCVNDVSPSLSVYPSLSTPISILLALIILDHLMLFNRLEISLSLVKRMPLTPVDALALAVRERDRSLKIKVYLLLVTCYTL